MKKTAALIATIASLTLLTGCATTSAIPNPQPLPSPTPSVESEAKTIEKYIQELTLIVENTDAQSLKTGYAEEYSEKSERGGFIVTLNLYDAAKEKAVTNAKGMTAEIPFNGLQSTIDLNQIINGTTDTFVYKVESITVNKNVYTINYTVDKYPTSAVVKVEDGLLKNLSHTNGDYSYTITYGLTKEQAKTVEEAPSLS
jgi:hypothetical protein